MTSLPPDLETTMTDLELTLDAATVQLLLAGDTDEALRLLTQQVLQQVLEMEMDEHLQAEPHERTDKRTGYRNSHTAG